ncbi:hypothetical protein ALC62_13305 [Cyphomyrmex costatus]|uniref:Uncharacterized protein n=1 Tax=Cyphomyrmex costatus TaxID=456900 RepID=A0A151IA79_9HYME|nr:hypothetical protein ALC62_13305 [Cyphomyrmex costatus]
MESIFLIGRTEPITGCSLPTFRQALASFFYYHNIMKLTVRDSVTKSVEDITKLWNLKNILVKPKRYSIAQLECKFNQWLKLKKNINRNTSTEQEKRAAFTVSLDKIFDIGQIIHVLDASISDAEKCSHAESQTEKLLPNSNNNFPQQKLFSSLKKVLPDGTQSPTSTRTDKLSIIVTGVNTEQLLEISNIQSGTGEAQASAVIKALLQWNLESKVIGLSFDTTASNTAPYKILFYLNFQLCQPRDDYKEFLEFVVIFLGEIPTRGIVFRIPGPIHHARWMAKALYSLKIFLFRSQFHLSARELSGLREICIFIIKLYVKAWFTSTLAISAPNRDLGFLKALHLYKSENAIVAQAALKKFSNHLWYLNHELVALGFFDPDVSVESKLKMVGALNAEETSVNRSKQPNIPNCESWLDKNLDDFVSSKTRTFFGKFGITTDFLDTHPSTWESRTDFRQGCEIVKHIKVTNDVVERAVALAENYNTALTKDERHRQDIYQIVSKHRQILRNCNKTTLKLDFSSTISQ